MCYLRPLASPLVFSSSRRYDVTISEPANGLLMALWTPMNYTVLPSRSLFTGHGGLYAPFCRTLARERSLR